MSGTIVSGSISVIPPDNPVNILVVVGGSPPYTIITPSGVTYYFTGGYIQNTLGTAERFFIQLDGGSILRFDMQANSTIFFSGEPCIAVASGETLTITTDTAGNGNLALWGYYQ